MAYLSIALLLVLGFLGAIQLIAAKKPEAKGLADKLAPYQGWIGVAGFAVGVFGLIRTLPHIGTLLEFAPIQGIVSLAACALLIVLGAMFGVSILRQFAGASSADKVEAKLAKLRPMQGMLGLASMGVGAWFLVLLVL